MNDGQAERQPLSTSDAATAIESLLTDNGDFADDPVTDSDPPADQGEEADESVSADEDRDESQDEPGDDDESGDDEPEPITLETIDDVAQALGVDPNDLLANLKMRIKVNGEERLVSLAEAQKGQQLEADYRRKTTELAEQRKALEQEVTQRQTLYQQQAAEAAHVLQLAEHVLVGNLNAPEMVQLRQVNPAEWVARREEANQKLAAIQQARQHVANQWQQQQQVAALEQKRQLEELVAQERQVLATKVDPQTWTPDTSAKLASFLMNTYGFSEDDVGSVYNHRLILLALDAMKGRESAAKATEVKQKVSKLPPVQKPGAKQTKIQVQANKLAELKARARKSGHIRDAAAVLESLL